MEAAALLMPLCTYFSNVHEEPLQSPASEKAEEKNLFPPFFCKSRARASNFRSVSPSLPFSSSRSPHPFPIGENWSPDWEGRRRWVGGDRRTEKRRGKEKERIRSIARSPIELQQTAEISGRDSTSGVMQRG